MKLLKIALATALICFPAILFCQERIDTDRPDQTESAFTVPKKYFQWEAGVIFEHTNLNDNLFSVPTSLFKYGVSNRFELRLETEFNSAVTANRTSDKKLAG